MENEKMLLQSNDTDVNKHKRNKWIEKQMNLERRTIRNIAMALSCVFGLVSLFLIYFALLPQLDGVYTLDSKEKLERFSQKNYVDAVLTYDTAFDMQGSFQVTSGDKLSVMMNGSYIEVPLKGASTDQNYHVWLLIGSGYKVLYCTEGTFEDSGKVHVQSQYREFSQQIIHDFLPNGTNVYVLYDAGSPVPYMTMLGVFILFSIFFVLLRRHPFFLKRTRLYRQLAMMGDYDTLSGEINQQALNPKFENANCTILKDWILFRSSGPFMSSGPTYTDIIPIGDVTGLDAVPDEEDSDTLACSFHVKYYKQPFVLYLNSEKLNQIRPCLPPL